MGGRVGTSHLSMTAGLLSEAELSAARLEVTGPLRVLLSDGLAAGSTVAVAGSAGLALALAAGVAGTQRWVACVGCDRLGLVAAHELGLGWERLVLVEPDSPPVWPGALAAAIDGFDIVIVGDTGLLGERHRRVLVARAKERSCLLITIQPAGTAAGGWPVDVRLRVAAKRWAGLDDGSGYLRQRQLRVEASGRGALAQARYLDVWLPGPGGPPKSVGQPPERIEVADRVDLARRAVS